MQRRWQPIATVPIKAGNLAGGQFVVYSVTVAGSSTLLQFGVDHAALASGVPDLERVGAHPGCGCQGLSPDSFARRRGASLTALPDRFLLHQGAIWNDTLVIFCSTIAVLTATA